MSRFIASEPSDPQSWDLAGSEQLNQSAVSGLALAELADEDPRIVVLTADVKYSSRTVEFERRHPDRFFNVGIAEQHMMTMAAGMATFGFVPYVATFASYASLLCAEQLRTDLAYPGLPVRIIAHHAGIALGFYGTSHHATEDLGLLRSMANMTVVCPCDAASTRRALTETVDYPGPVYLRLGRGREPDVYGQDAANFQVGRLSQLRAGDDLTFVANGTTVHAALGAAEQLAAEGIQVGVFDAHTVRPFDAEGLCSAVARSGRLVVAEEHNVIGGVASACADAIVDAGLSGVPMTRVGMPADEYALIGPPTALWRHYGLDAEGLAAAARESLGSAPAA
jgi:transketolase